MFGVIAFILGIIAAILAWLGDAHAVAFIYGAVAFIALEIVFARWWGPARRGPVA